jgi:hypothetical protein
VVPPLRAVLTAASLLLLAAPSALAAPRPDQGGTTVFGQPGWTEPEAPGSPYCTAHACVHWVDTTADAPVDLTDGDADGVPDSIEYTADGIERGWRTLVAPAPTGLGWRRPLGDGALGGGTDLVDVYIKRLEGKAAGVASVDSQQNPPSQAPKRYHGFVVIDPVYLGRGSWGFLQRKLGPHELQHLIEYAYDAWFESWNGESTAEWSVTQSDRSFGFFLGYPSAWGQATELPMLDVRDAEHRFPPPKAYLSVVWQRWLELRHGAQMIREVWERGAEAAPASFVPNLVDEVLTGKSTFFDEFVDFSVAHAEWRAPGSGFGTDPGTYEVERVGTLRAGGERATATLDHTTFALYDVPVSDAAAYELRATAPEGTSAAVALVGRTGDAATGTVETQVQRLPAGGAASVGFADPARFTRITAVLVNADVKLADPPKTPEYEWAYARDDQRSPPRCCAPIARRRPPRRSSARSRPTRSPRAPARRRSARRRSPTTSSRRSSPSAACRAPPCAGCAPAAPSRSGRRSTRRARSPSSCAPARP